MLRTRQMEALMAAAVHGCASFCNMMDGLSLNPSFMLQNAISLVPIAHSTNVSHFHVPMSSPKLQQQMYCTITTSPCTRHWDWRY